MKLLLSLITLTVAGIYVKMLGGESLADMPPIVLIMGLYLVMIAARLATEAFKDTTG